MNAWLKDVKRFLDDPYKSIDLLDKVMGCIFVAFVVVVFVTVLLE